MLSIQICNGRACDAARPLGLSLVLMVLVGACAAPSRGPAERVHTSPQPVAAEQGQAGTATASARSPIIVEGTGVLVGTPQPSTLPERAPTDGYQLSFFDTEIASVVSSVIGEGLGLPYVIDPAVKGTMTLQATRPLAREEVLPALEAALNMHGVALVEAQGTYQVVQMKEAPRRIGGLRAPGQAGAAGYAVRIVPLRFVGVSEMEKALRPFAPEGGILRVDEGRNVLLIAGTSRELAIMQEVIDTFDVNWLAGMSFAIYPVDYVDVKTLTEELSEVFADERSPMRGTVRLVPLSRLNSVMVITHERDYLRAVEAWIKRLDIGATTPGRRIYVYDVQNGKADDLAESLSEILSISVAEAGRRRPTSSSERSDASAGAVSAGTPATSPRQSGVRPGGSGQSADAGELRIVPNVENNALLIYATPSEFAIIENALRRLDVTPIQVLIEASLAEVSLTDDLRFGVQWAFQGGDGPTILSDASNGAINQQFPGFSYLYTGRTDIRAVLNALESVTDVDVISSPKLLVLNNREAELQIGDQVPIIVQSAVSTDGDAAPIVNSVQLRDTGVILRITPRVNRSGLVLLDVAQEISDVVPTTTSNIDSPTIQQRRISSSVAVRDGETIALGGLIRDSTSRTRAGVPLVTKIPLIGGLFGSTGKNVRRTELIVLITPRVLRSGEEVEALMDDLREQFRGLRGTLPEWTGRGPRGKSHASSTPVDVDDADDAPEP